MQASLRRILCTTGKHAPFHALESRTSLYMAAGVGLYWGSTVFSFLGLSYLPDSIMPNLIGTVIGILAAAAGLGSSRAWFHRKGQKRLAAATLSLSVLNIVLALGSAWGIEPPMLVLVCTNGCAGALLMLFWGLNLAALDRKTAERTVLLGAAIAGIALFLLLLIPPVISRYVSVILRGLTPCLFLFGGYDLPVVKRTFRPECKNGLVAFYASRALFGLLIGATYHLALTTTKASVSPQPLWVTAFLVFSLLLLAWCASHPSSGAALLSALPMCLAGALMLCFQNESELTQQAVGFSQIPFSCTAALWFAWIALTSLQISEFKEEFGMDEVTLSFSEKGIVSLFWMIGEMGAILAGHMGLLGPENINRFCLTALLVWFIVCTYSFTKLASTKERGRLLDERSESAQERTKKACEALSKDFGLSSRECEALQLLVLGHTRAYISEQMNISPSTVQTHLSHLYQKLDVHNREAVIEIVCHYQEKIDNNKRYKNG